MKLRTVSWPEDLHWTTPLVTPADMHAAATAQQVIEQAQQRARSVMRDAEHAVATWEAEVRSQFLADYAKGFHQAVEGWVQARQTMLQSMQKVAQQIAHATLKRLGSALSVSERLQAVIHEVLQSHIPQADCELRVASDRCADVQAHIDAWLAQPAAARLSGIVFHVVADATLREDEVVLMGPDGARIQCSFEQIVRQLLLFI